MSAGMLSTSVRKDTISEPLFAAATSADGAAPPEAPEPEAPSPPPSMSGASEWAASSPRGSPSSDHVEHAGSSRLAAAAGGAALPAGAAAADAADALASSMACDACGGGAGRQGARKW